MERDLRVISNVDFILLGVYVLGLDFNHGIRGITRNYLTQRRRVA
jgi:hypothetical protein